MNVEFKQLLVRNPSPFHADKPSLLIHCTVRSMFVGKTMVKKKNKNLKWYPFVRDLVKYLKSGRLKVMQITLLLLSRSGKHGFVPNVLSHCSQAWWHFYSCNTDVPVWSGIRYNKAHVLKLSTVLFPGHRSESYYILSHADLGRREARGFCHHWYLKFTTFIAKVERGTVELLLNDSGDALPSALGTFVYTIEKMGCCVHGVINWSVLKSGLCLKPLGIRTEDRK